jgi:hypothetical protein
MIVTSPCIMTNRSKTKKYIYHIYTNPTKSVTLHGKPKIVHCCYIHVLEKKKKNWKMSKQIKMYQVHYSKKNQEKKFKNYSQWILWCNLWLPSLCSCIFGGEKKYTYVSKATVQTERERELN